ncbi:hypothetical protein [Mycolicibacterium sp.]|uniref:hypothetical protein n=1 Tax=Mycolicibacterium sp. TaxID=2320850 RepID=UPI003D0F241C
MSDRGIADRFAHDIVTFMRSWAPYGGPPDDEVLPEFGMTRTQLIQRYRQIIDAELAQREYERRHAWLALRRSASEQ